MQKNKQFYDNFFSRYPINIHDNNPRFRAVSEILSAKVLDVACGTGTLSKYYAGDYVGVDISDVAIAKAKKSRRKNAKFMQADFTKSIFASKEKFDSVYLGEFLEHIENDDFVFENLMRVITPYARIVITVPNGERVPDESHCRIFTVASIRRVYSKYGKITFHNWDGFEKRIMFSIDLNAPQTDEISLVMICKDEAKGIEKSIISALPFVDRVVVSVDDQTTDKTREIAEMYADELRTHKWQNDFSKARNEAQENVKSKWILFLDGHEYIQDFGKIREYLKEDVDGIFVTVKMETGMTFLYPRIFRSHLKFKNAVHNLVECKTKRGCPSFLIVHDRLNLQAEDAIERRNKQRDEMMPSFLRKQIKENKRNSRAHFHLANYLMMRNEPKKAIKHFNKVVKYGKSKDEIFMSLISKGRIHLGLGQTFRALWAFDSANELQPNRWETARVLGGFYLIQGHYKKAVDFLVRALERNKQHYSYEPMQQSFMEIWDLIGHCFQKLEQPAQALIAWRQAQKHAEDPKMKAFFGEKIRLIKMLLPNSNEPATKIKVEDKNEAQ